MAQADSTCSKITRRAAIAALGVAPAGALPSLGASASANPAAAATPLAAPALPNPVSAAIAAHRAAVAALDAAASHLSDVEEGVFDDGGQDRGTDAHDDPVLLAAEAAFEAACDAESRSAWALARLAPPHPAAAAALLRYAGEVEADGTEWPEPPDNERGEWSSTFHLSLAAGLEAMA
jgi:hypothetical protein